jgi:hypothetical protein
MFFFLSGQMADTAGKQIRPSIRDWLSASAPCNCCGAAAGRFIGDPLFSLGSYDYHNPGGYNDRHPGLSIHYSKFNGIHVGEVLHPEYIHNPEVEYLDEIIYKGESIGFVRSAFKSQWDSHGYSTKSNCYGSPLSPAKRPLTFVTWNSISNGSRHWEDDINIARPWLEKGLVDSQRTRCQDYLYFLKQHGGLIFFIITASQKPTFDRHRKLLGMDDALVLSRERIFNLNCPTADNPRLNWYIFDTEKL